MLSCSFNTHGVNRVEGIEVGREEGENSQVVTPTKPISKVILTTTNVSPALRVLLKYRKRGHSPVRRQTLSKGTHQVEPLNVRLSCTKLVIRVKTERMENTDQRTVGLRGSKD